ncbi:hypothetical protein RvY_17533 [Ramazzottius varieornatus]|uniref:RBR-type E3 ubiquitin transferase n=1 Tax=Ramazzottius varieornatus TaxID=947166 RepID=A0A1D1W387_RAMVA|nr:hypothetical protein RvY_17533 [Ramazzottius varieornatus]
MRCPGTDATDKGEMRSGLKCGHGFCGECWKTYLHSQVDAEASSGAIQCPQNGCHTVMDDLFVMEMSDDYDILWDGHRQKLVNRFVAGSAIIRWCPKVSCGSAIRMNAEDEDSNAVTCATCSAEFCFPCRLALHEPISCQIMMRWKEEYEAEGADVEYLLTRTKLCPKCDLIERIAGEECLQTNVEVLSALLSGSCFKTKQDQHRLAVIDKTTCCQGLLTALTRHIQEGLKNQTWTFAT